MPAMVCPKCGFHQEGGTECNRCGIIFDRYNPTQRSQGPTRFEDTPQRRLPGLIRRIYRVFSLASLGIFVIALFLLLRPAAPPRIPVTSEDVQRADAKVRHFQASLQESRPERLEMDESELNGWLGANLAIPQAQGVDSPPPPKKEGAVTPPAREGSAAADASAGLEEVQSSVRDVKIRLQDDTLRAYVLFDLYGKNLSLELEGRLAVRDGHLRLEPTRGWLGSLPLPQGTLESAAQHLFDSPENKEKFLLPETIRDIHIERGQLVVSSR